LEEEVTVKKVGNAMLIELGSKVDGNEIYGLAKWSGRLVWYSA